MPRSTCSLADAVAPARARHHRLVDAARRWAVSSLVWLPSDVVALVIDAATQGAANRGDGPPDGAERADPAVERRCDSEDRCVDDLGADAPDQPLPGTYWTRRRVNDLVMHDVPAWCRARRTTMPVHVAESTWRYLDFLADTGRMHPASDPLEELRRPLRCYGELGPTGRWEPDAAFDPGPCVCFEPYVGPTFGEVHGPSWRRLTS